MTMYDLTTPDGLIEKIEDNHAIVLFEHISAQFLGFKIDPKMIQFNLKSVLAQLGIDASLLKIETDFGMKRIRAEVNFIARNPLGLEMLKQIHKGAYVG
ncbi:MAG: hypothetical protein KGQ54_03405, partial [Verrucomicrobia bacterium]|nr:hypothetical protein [Verrucomicrobiota bacterium]